MEVNDSEPEKFLTYKQLKASKDKILKEISDSVLADFQNYFCTDSVSTSDSEANPCIKLSQKFSSSFTVSVKGEKLTSQQLKTIFTKPKVKSISKEFNSLNKL